MATVGDWLNEAKTRLASSTAFEDDVNLTLKFLVEARLNLTYPFLSETVLSIQEESQLGSDLEELFEGNPLPYIIGDWSFYGLDFFITSDVLIPRPETELMVEEALRWLSEFSEERHPIVYDIGTGSGIIAITIAKYAPSSLIIASDISTGALSVCEQNIEFHKVDQKITTALADGLPIKQDKIDLLCANLPYIPRFIVDELIVTQHEPRLALDGGDDGLRIIEKVIAQSVSRMNPRSLLLFEIEASQGQLARSLAANYYPYSTISVLDDLSGKNRILRIENK